jgi:hypothetical protein
MIELVIGQAGGRNKAAGEEAASNLAVNTRSFQCRIVLFEFLLFKGKVIESAQEQAHSAKAD